MSLGGCSLIHFAIFGIETPLKHKAFPTQGIVCLECQEQLVTSKKQIDRMQSLPNVIFPLNVRVQPAVVIRTGTFWQSVFLLCALECISYLR